MKYLKLYEAFQSNILTKTISFIKEDKVKFMEVVDRVCSSIDFPKSKLSDDFFSYLPFDAALQANHIEGDEPCDAKSERAFPEHPVPGATCEGGKIKRMWGSRQREVVCPICNGTGVKRKTAELKLIKFWFSIEGKFIDVSAVDGVIRKESSGGSIPQNPSFYKEILRTENKNDLNFGDYVKANIRGEAVYGRIFREGSRVYLIQNKHSGSEPSSREWRKWGRYAWVMTTGEYAGVIVKLELKKEDELNEPDPYTWNVGLDIRRYGGMGINTIIDLQPRLKDAHFAIVMDFGKIKKSGFTKKIDIQVSREEGRKGALALKSDEDIKRENIERYVKKIADNLTSGDQMTMIKRIIPIMFGGQHSICWILTGLNFSALDVLVTYLHRFFTDGESNQDYWSEKIVDIIKNRYKSDTKILQRINSHWKEIYTSLNKYENKESIKPVFQELEKLSQKINEMILKKPVETIDDLEHIYQNILTIRNFMRSDRMDLQRIASLLDSLLNYESFDGRPQYRLEDFVDSVSGDDSEKRIQKVLGDIKKASLFIDRL